MIILKVWDENFCSKLSIQYICLAPLNFRFSSATSNHSLITRSKVSLDSSGFLAQEFWSWFCKLPLFDTPN